jgi:hypothetical protein
MLNVAIVATLLSCKSDPTTESGPEPYVPQHLEETPTEDIVGNAFPHPALFMGSNSSMECKALKRRLTVVSYAGLEDQNLHTLIIGTDELHALSPQEVEHLRALFARGGNILVLTPDAPAIAKLAQYLGKAVDIPILPSADLPFSMMAFKRGKAYLALKVDEEATNDYLVGKRMDKTVEWLSQKAVQLSGPVLKDNDAEQQALQDLIDAQEITVDQGIDVKLLNDNDKWWTTYHNISITYRIWKAHSFDDGGKDYYCIKEEVTAYNQDLKCGPEAEDEWTGISSDWNSWRKAYEDAGMNPSLYWIYRVYGPYMHFLGITNSLSSDSQQAVRVEAYDPENNTSGGATVTESFSYSLGANMGASSSGPTAGASLGLSWGTSVAQFSPDLKAIANISQDGQVIWKYTGARPGTHFNVFSTNTHDLAKNILKNTCTLHHAWVWSLPSQDNVVHLNGSLSAYDEWVTYWESPYETHELYFGPGIEAAWSFDIAAPPHFKQEWSMTVEPANQAVEDYLAAHLGKDYFWSNAVFFTQKESHTDGDTDDEIANYVALSKQYFDNNPDIMQLAAQAGGITDHYTIHWHDLKSAGTPDFSYEVTVNN